VGQSTLFPVLRKVFSVISPQKYVEIVDLHKTNRSVPMSICSQIHSRKVQVKLFFFDPSDWTVTTQPQIKLFYQRAGGSVASSPDESPESEVI